MQKFSEAQGGFRKDRLSVNGANNRVSYRTWTEKSKLCESFDGNDHRNE